MNDSISAADHANTEPGADAESVESPDAVDFTDFALDERLLNAVIDLGFETPTPIQREAIPMLLKGRDVIGSARTGSGKTAAFGLPLLHHLADGPDVPRALILTPTRELCSQVSAALHSFSRNIKGLRISTVYGGAPYAKQTRELQGGCRVVVGTPGRVIDHLERGTFDLSTLEVFVLDEADEMLQMGFIDDVDKVLALAPKERQIALFSATMPKAIRGIADRYLREPMLAQPDSPRARVDHVQQRYMIVPSHHKIDALQRVLRATERDATLVFARTRAACAEMADTLTRRGVAIDALHGDLPQPARERVISRLRSRRIDVVIATDVAARGLDVDHISHVINLDLPMNAEVYVHRIGRTARAGRSGMAISFVTPGERRKISGFTKRLRIDMQQMRVPSDAEIAKVERERLIKALVSAPPTTDATTEVYRALVGITGWKPRQVAELALRALAQRERVDLGLELDDEPPQWGRPRPRRDAENLAGTAELLIHAGRKDGARPGDIVASLAKGLKVPIAMIGRITVTATKCFARLPEEQIEALTAATDTLIVRGKKVRFERARARGAVHEKNRSRERAARGRPNRGDAARPRHDHGRTDGPRGASRRELARKARKERKRNARRTDRGGGVAPGRGGDNARKGGQVQRDGGKRGGKRGPKPGPKS